MLLNIKVSKITILTRPGNTDYISIFTTLPSSFPPGISNDNLIISFEAQKGTGVDYVKNNFNIEPEILNINWSTIIPKVTMMKILA